MKRLLLVLLCLLLIMTGCLNIRKQEDIVQTDEENKTEISILPNHQLAKSQYKMLLPFRPSKARDAITNQITNRVDIDELEDGLRRHSTEVFDPEKYVYEDGQYFTTDHIFNLIDELNPDIEKKDKKEEQ